MSKLIWFIPRSASTSYAMQLADSENMKYFGELYGPWNENKELMSAVTSANSVMKLQGAQFENHKHLILPYLSDQDILIMKPRSLLESYTSFILAYAHAKQNCNNNRMYWIPSHTDNDRSSFKAQVKSVSYEDAVDAVDKYTRIVQAWVNNYHHFAHGRVVDRSTMIYDPVWSFTEKIGLLKSWEDVRALIIHNGEPLWDQIEYLLSTSKV